MFTAEFKWFRNNSFPPFFQRFLTNNCSSSEKFFLSHLRFVVNIRRKIYVSLFGVTQMGTIIVAFSVEMSRRKPAMEFSLTKHLTVCLSSTVLGHFFGGGGSAFSESVLL